MRGGGERRSVRVRAGLFANGEGRGEGGERREKGRESEEE